MYRFNLYFLNLGSQAIEWKRVGSQLQLENLIPPSSYVRCVYCHKNYSLGFTHILHHVNLTLKAICQCYTIAEYWMCTVTDYDTYPQPISMINVYFLYYKIFLSNAHLNVLLRKAGMSRIFCQSSPSQQHQRVQSLNTNAI